MIVISELDCSYINGAGGGLSEALMLLKEPHMYIMQQLEIM